MRIPERQTIDVAETNRGDKGSKEEKPETKQESGGAHHASTIRQRNTFSAFSRLEGGCLGG
jgi:hypothetical protein